MIQWRHYKILWSWSVEDILYMDHHICVVRLSLLLLISLHLSFGSQALPQFFCFSEVPLLLRALFRHEKPHTFLCNFGNFFASFQTQSLRTVFAQILDVIGPCILRVFLQKAFPNPHFRYHSPRGGNCGCGIGNFFFFQQTRNEFSTSLKFSFLSTNI